LAQVKALMPFAAVTVDAIRLLKFGTSPTHPIYIQDLTPSDFHMLHHKK